MTSARHLSTETTLTETTALNFNRDRSFNRDNSHTKIANALDRALHLKAVIRIEEDEQTPRIAALRRDEKKTIIDSASRLFYQMSVANEKIRRSSDGRRDNSHWGGTRRHGNRYREQGLRDRAITPTTGPNTRERNDNPRRENSFDKCPLCGQKGHCTKNCRNCFFFVEFLPTINEIALGTKGRNKPA